MENCSQSHLSVVETNAKLPFSLFAAEAANPGPELRAGGLGTEDLVTEAVLEE